jgi:hypothetical protein
MIIGKFPIMEQWLLLEPKINPVTEKETTTMKNYTNELNKEDRVALDQWLDQRELELLQEESYLDEVLYGRQERQAREKYFKANPDEKYDSPDFYIERD